MMYADTHAVLQGSPSACSAQGTLWRAQSTDSTPDGGDDGGAYTGMTPQAAATMSAAKCSVKLATLQVTPLVVQ